MQIAININSLPYQAEPALRYFLQALFQQWTGTTGGHQFLFIGQKDENVFLNESNNSFWLEAPAPGKSIMYQYWQMVRLPVLLKKNKTEVLISAGGLNIIPARIPSVLLVYGKDLRRGKDKGFAKLLQQAALIIVFTDKDAAQLSHEYSIQPEQIVVLKAAPAFNTSPLNFDEKTNIKNRYTDGKEFSTSRRTTGAHQNPTTRHTTLSVSQKKHGTATQSPDDSAQGTGTKLLLEGPIHKKDKAFTDSLSHYKYRDELVLTGELTAAERASLIAAAYALVDPAMRPHAGIPVLEAAAAGVPSLAIAGHPVLQAGTYLTADMTDYVDMASGLMQLYKDEGLRNQLIQQLTATIPDHQFEKTVASFDKILQPLLR